MTGLPSDRLAELISRVREIVGEQWEKPPAGRPHVLPLPTAVVAVLFGLRHNMADEVVAEAFGCSQATITRYHQILQPILRWVTRPEVDQRMEQGRREGVVGDPVNGARHDAAAFFISGIAERWADHYAVGGPGMIGDGGYQGTGPITLRVSSLCRSHRSTDQPSPLRRALVSARQSTRCCRAVAWETKPPRHPGSRRGDLRAGSGGRRGCLACCWKSWVAFESRLERVGLALAPARISTR